MAARKTMFECRLHGLRYERFNDGAPDLDCPCCMRDRLNEAQVELEDVKKQRDALLAAIEIKLSVEVE